MKRDFYFSKARGFGLTALLVLLIIGFIVAEIYMLSDPGEHGAVIVFFSAVILLLIWSLFLLGKNFLQKEANVTVSEDGLTVRGTAGPGFIPWEDIEGMLPYEVHNNELLGIILKNEADYIESLPKNKRRLAKINLKTGFPAFNIGLSNLKEKKELVNLLVEMKIPFYIPTNNKETQQQSNPPKDKDLSS
ncbi:PH domain-containing protein [Bacillus sp. JJ1609]|uniref:PH domain-containing protein n=1 Tax=Bacillus sp. JJ1609 TaxID=3122977 RepID=UPI0030004D9A